MGEFSKCKNSRPMLVLGGCEKKSNETWTPAFGLGFGLDPPRNETIFFICQIFQEETLVIFFSVVEIRIGAFFLLLFVFAGGGGRKKEFFEVDLKSRETFSRHFLKKLFRIISDSELFFYFSGFWSKLPHPGMGARKTIKKHSGE